MNKFKEGDLAVLKSGGAVMLVKGVEKDKVVLIWNSLDGKPQSATITSDCLYKLS